MSIGMRLLSSILGVVILGVASVGYWTASLSNNALTESIKAQQSALVTGAARLIEDQLNTLQVAVKEIKDKDSVSNLLYLPGRSLLQEEVKDYLNYKSRELNGIEYIGVFSESGVLITGTGPHPPSEKQWSTQPFFRQAMLGKACISLPIEGNDPKNLIFYIAEPVQENDTVYGVVCMIVQLSSLTDLLKKINIGKDGYAFMFMPPGRTIAHIDPQRIFENTSSFPWVQEMFRQKQGVLDYEFANIGRLAGFHDIKQTGWMIALAAEKHDVLAAARQIRNTTIISGIALLLCVCVVVFFVVRNITSALHKDVAFARAVAAGNLDETLHVNRRDELGILATALHTMVSELRKKISQAEEKTKEAKTQAELAQKAVAEAHEAKAQAENAHREGLLEAADRLDVIVVRLASASEELSAQIEQASQAADQQRNLAQDASAAMEQMSRTVTEVAHNAANTAETTTQAHTNAVSGADAVEKVVSAINEVHQKAQKMNAQMADLATQATGIGRILDVITDIADQTNLLALNAAIEAARAGEAGRGFAVVADEVRKLAEKTMTSTHEVEQAIRSIQSGTEENIHGMHEAAKAVAETTELAGNAGAALTQIVKLVEASTDQVRSIAESNETQSTTAESIAKSIEEVNNTAGETAENMRQSSIAITDLAEMAQQLRNLVEEMKNA